MTSHWTTVWLQMWPAPKNFQGYWFFSNSLRISQLPSMSTTGTTLIALFNCLLWSPDEPGSCFCPIGGLLLIIALICSCFPRKLGAITLGKPHPAADPLLANAPAQHGQDDFPEDSCSAPPVQEEKSIPVQKIMQKLKKKCIWITTMITFSRTGK